MKQTAEQQSIFITIKYIFKFTFFLLQEKVVKLKQIQEQFITYRDAHLDTKVEEKKPEVIVKYPKIKVQKKRSKLTFPLLVLFDAENMPIQDHYKLIHKIIIKKFGHKSWDNAKLETAYQESTEYFNNKGYNQDIKVHYVSRGENKADDKLVEIAKSYKIPHVVIVSNDKELISRLQDVTAKYTSGKLFVFNGAFFKEYTLSATQIELSRLVELKIKREKLIKEYEYVDAEIAKIEGRTVIASQLTMPLNKIEEVKNRNEVEKIEKVEKKETISENLKEAMLDENIKESLIKTPLFINFTEQLKQVEAPTKEEARIQSQKVLELFTELPRITNLLETKGLNINIFKIGLRYAIRDFDQSNYGYSSFVQFIQYVVKGSEVKLVLKGTSEYKLLLKDTQINELEMSEVVEKTTYNINDNLLSDSFGNSFADLMEGYKKAV